MIWARCRGGKLFRTPRAVGVGQQPREAVLLVAAAEAPDGSGIALPAGGDAVDRFAPGEGQEDPGALDLEERERGLTGDALQEGEVSRGEDNRARFATAHGATSRQEKWQRCFLSSIAAAPNFLQDFWPGPLATQRTPVAVSVG
jgi:hypothetical protein